MGDMQLKPSLCRSCALRGERKFQADDLRIGWARGDNRPKSDIDLSFRAAMWRVYGRREREGTDAAAF